MGVAASLNIGIDLALKQPGNISYIARMDSDDVALPERLQLQQHYLETNPDCDIVGSSVRQFTGDFQSAKVSGKINCLPQSNDLIKFNMHFYCTIAHPTIMFRVASIGHLMKYHQTMKLKAEPCELNPMNHQTQYGVILREPQEHELEQKSDQENKFQHLEDYELWLRLIHLDNKYVSNNENSELGAQINTEQGQPGESVNKAKQQGKVVRFFNIGSVLLHYRKHGSSVTSMQQNVQIEHEVPLKQIYLSKLISKYSQLAKEIEKMPEIVEEFIRITGRTVRDQDIFSRLKYRQQLVDIFTEM